MEIFGKKFLSLNIYYSFFLMSSKLIELKIYMFIKKTNIYISRIL